MNQKKPVHVRNVCGENHTKYGKKLMIMMILNDETRMKKRKGPRSACMHKNVLFKIPYAILLKHFKHAKWPFVPLNSLVVSISKKKTG